MKKQTINDRLMDAVSQYNLKAVQYCLENGANPNYSNAKNYNLTDINIQPTNPLKLVVFRISDCMLNDKDLKQYVKIAKLLIKYGADAKPAFQFAESRYGKYNLGNQTGAFMDVWNVIANAL